MAVSGSSSGIGSRRLKKKTNSIEIGLSLPQLRPSSEPRAVGGGIGMGLLSVNSMMPQTRYSQNQNPNQNEGMGVGLGLVGRRSQQQLQNSQPLQQMRVSAQMQQMQIQPHQSQIQGQIKLGQSTQLMVPHVSTVASSMDSLTSMNTLVSVNSQTSASIEVKSETDSTTPSVNSSIATVNTTGVTFTGPTPLVDGTYPKKKPVGMKRAKKWSPDVENSFRFQAAGYRDMHEYLESYPVPEYWDSGFVKMLMNKKSGYYMYFRRMREVNDGFLNRIKIYSYEV